MYSTSRILSTFSIRYTTCPNLFLCLLLFFFFFNDTATTEIYTLSLHDALPIYGDVLVAAAGVAPDVFIDPDHAHTVESGRIGEDRKSTRLNSSHITISYTVFCLKKKITKNKIEQKLILTIKHSKEIKSNM